MIGIIIFVDKEIDVYRYGVNYHTAPSVKRDSKTHLPASKVHTLPKTQIPSRAKERFPAELSIAKGGKLKCRALVDFFLEFFLGNFKD